MMNYAQQRFYDMTQQVVPRRKGSVTNGLNLILELENPAHMPVLLSAIMTNRRKTEKALRSLNFVHYARFLPARGDTALQVVTVYDGDLDPYVNEFTAAIGDVFDAMLSFVKADQRPTLPVQDHPREFLDFVKKHNQVIVRDAAIEPWPLYSSYPDKTVLEITGPAPEPAGPFYDARPHQVDLADIQGNVVRAYRGAQVARHLALSFGNAEQAKRFLRAITVADAADLPLVTPEASADKQAQDGSDYCLNVGFTFAGLQVLGLSEVELASFPLAFREGPASKTKDGAGRSRAEKNGDAGPSDPAYWVLGAPGQPVHLIVSLLAREPLQLNRQGNKLVRFCEQQDITILWEKDTARLPDSRGHFGYRDGISQPRIAGIPDPTLKEDMQPQAGVGEFLLGAQYTGSFGGNPLGDMPPRYASNGTFAAVRIMEQNVAAFERTLTEAARQSGISREEVAAKLMGRWRNGDPLTLKPVATVPGPEVAIKHEDQNRFDYAPTTEFPTVPDDFHGAVCPVGSHIRRMNPRSAAAAGKPYSRRLIRRGMPYEWSRADDPNYGGENATERGLFGVFICSDLERQYEFLLQQWARGDIAASGVRNTQDPIIGRSEFDTEAGNFNFVRAAGQAPEQWSVAPLVKTRGSVYLFMPGMGGLQALAGSGEVASTGATGQAARSTQRMGFSADGFDPAYFDVRDPAFRNNLYEYYAHFRRHHPVFRIREHDSYWVFTHDLVEQVCQEKRLFLKKPNYEKWVRGLFFMDEPDHTRMRGAMNEIFGQVLGGADPIRQEVIAAAIADLQTGNGEVDLLSTFTKRVPRDTFMRLFGVAASEAPTLDGIVNFMLQNRDLGDPANIRVKAVLGQARTEEFLVRYLRQEAAPIPGSILHRMLGLVQQQKASPGEFVLTAVHMLLGGYLSTEFLMTTGIYNYLTAYGPTPGARPPLAPNAVYEMLRFDAPFQLADRYAAQATVLGGVKIPENARVVLAYGSANRDEAVFKEPDKFDVQRSDAANHYGFGRGIHRCIGEMLAAPLTHQALAALFQAFPDLTLKLDKPDWLKDPYFRSLKELPARLR